MGEVRQKPRGGRPHSLRHDSSKSSGEVFRLHSRGNGYSPLPQTDKKVGVDLGLKQIVVLSTGETIEHPRYWRRYEEKLAYWQRVMARRKPGGSNWEKARLKVAKLHEKSPTAGTISCTNCPPASSAKTKWCAWRTCVLGTCKRIASWLNPFPIPRGGVFFACSSIKRHGTGGRWFVLRARFPRVNCARAAGIGTSR